MERCNRDPSDPACVPDAGTVGDLTYRTLPVRRDDAWTDVQLGLCGEFVREIDWLMPAGAPADGFIVQQVDIDLSATCSVSSDSPLLDTCTDPPSAEHLPAACVDADGRPSVAGYSIRFWEAFPMASGDVVYDGEDRWNLLPQAVPRGEATIVGAARFYRAEDLAGQHPESPESPFVTHPIDVPGSRLVATDRRPDFWRDDERMTLDRRMRVSWSCCPSQVTVLEEDTHDR